MDVTYFNVLTFDKSSLFAGIMYMLDFLGWAALSFSGVSASCGRSIRIEFIPAVLKLNACPCNGGNFPHKNVRNSSESKSVGTIHSLSRPAIYKIEL